MLSPIWHDSRKWPYFCGSWLNIWRQIGWFLQAGCSTSYTIVPDADMIPGDSQSQKKTAPVSGLFFGIFVKTCLLPVPGMAEQLETFLGEPEQVLPSISYHIISSISLPYHIHIHIISTHLVSLPYHINHIFHMLHIFHIISTTFPSIPYQPSHWSKVSDIISPCAQKPIDIFPLSWLLQNILQLLHQLIRRWLVQGFHQRAFFLRSASLVWMKAQMFLVVILGSGKKL